MAKDIVSMLSGKWEDGTRPADLYETIIAKKPREYLDVVIAGLGSEQKRVQGGCAELASRMSADHPELVYPHVELFLRNLRAKEPILRWEAACTVGNLAAVDARAAIPPHVQDLIALLSDKSVVLQGHAVRALGKIAARFPALAPNVFDALTGSTKFFPGTRVGYVVEAMEHFVGQKALAKKVRAFLVPYAQSEHAPVSRKAKHALKLFAE